MFNKCVGINKACTCTKCAEIRQYIADSAAKRLVNRTHWTHVITHNHHHGLRHEWVSAHDGLTLEEAIASRVRRLRDTPPTNGWSRTGMTLHIRQRDEEQWVTYQGPDAHTKEWRTVDLLDEQDA